MSKQVIEQEVLGQVLGPLADNERLKRESKNLRGTIEQDLQDRITGGFTADNFQLIRFHGMYQQDDRDIRNERTKQKLEPLHNVMLRARMPGRIITLSSGSRLINLQMKAPLMVLSVSQLVKLSSFTVC